MKNDELLHKWYNNTLSESELKIFKQRPEYESLVALQSDLVDIDGPDFDQEQMLVDILSTSTDQAKSNIAKETPVINSQTNQYTKPKIFKLIPFGIAASVLLLAGYFLFPRTNMVNYDIAKDQMVEGTLPDQSTFVLQGESHLTYDKNSWDNARDLTLRGEAFFSVQKGSTFTVNTDRGSVKVLGTQFNVLARGDLFEVNCKEGKVAVHAKDTPTILTAGESVLLQGAKKSILRARDLTRIKNASLETLLSELSNTFDIQFETDGINMNSIISCNYQHSDIDLALKTTITPLGITYIKTGTKIKLSN